MLCCVSKIVVVPDTFKIPNSVSPTPTLNPAAFFILILPVVEPLPSVGRKFSADLSFPASSTSFLAFVAVPLHQNPVVAVSWLESAILKPLYNFCLLGVNVSSGSSLSPGIE